MTALEVKKLFSYIGALYPNFGKGKSDDAKRLMLKAWGNVLADLPLQPACDGLKQSLLDGNQYPPSSPGDVLQRAQKYLPRKRDIFDELTAKTAHECLGMDTTVYLEMQREKIKIKEETQIERNQQRLPR